MRKVTPVVVTTLVAAVAIGAVGYWVRLELDPEVRVLRTLSSPVRVIQTAFYFDGGSITLTLEGANGNTLQCGINRTTSMEILPYHGQICFYAGHATNEGAKMIPRGGLAERRLLKMLRKWLAVTPPTTVESELLRPGIVENFIEIAERSTN